MNKSKPKQKPERYWSTKTPPGRYDYIVIGSGMGGMSSAAMLAKLGKRVLVLEQHYVPGGFTHTFKRKGWVWDVGVHAIGEVTEKSKTGRLLHALTDGRLQWETLGETYEEFYYPDGFRIDFPDTPQKFQAALLEAFPGEQKALDAYFAKIKEVAGGMMGYYMARTLPAGMGRVADRTFARSAQGYLRQRTMDVLDELTDNERLKAVLVSQWGYYGAPPSRASFAMHALLARHFLWGAYYPVGGSQRIAVELLRTVADAGGWTRINADVEEILVHRGKAIGVRLRGKDGAPGEEILADRVISAAGVWSTVARLLPAGYRDERWVSEVTKLKPGPAHVCLYLGFEGDIREAGCSAANKWFVDTWDTNFEYWDVRAGQPVGRAPLLYCSYASLKDPNHDPGPKQRHTGEIVTFVPWETFEPWLNTRWKKRPEDYEELKQQMHEQLLEQYLEQLPELRPMIKYAELSTPLTTDHFVRPAKGSIYGLEPTPERFATMELRPRAPIENLFFSGSEVTTVGVMGAMMGGILATLSAEPVAGMRYLGRVG